MDSVLYKTTLEHALRGSWLNSSGLEITSCIVKVDRARNMALVDLTVSVGRLNNGNIEPLAQKAFQSSVVESMAHWNIIHVESVNAKTVSVHAEGTARGLTRGLT